MVEKDFLRRELLTCLKHVRCIFPSPQKKTQTKQETRQRQYSREYCLPTHAQKHTHTYEHVFVYPSRGHALKLCSSCSFSAPHSRNNIWSYVCQPMRSISLNSIINITYSSGVSMSATVHAG